MPVHFKKARDRCWKIHNKFYDYKWYKHHDARYRQTITKYLKSDTIMLDAGCGLEMKFVHEFSSKVRMAVGADIEKLKPTVSGPYAVQCDLHNLPFKDNIFDIIISMSVFEHLANPEKVLLEFSRILRATGVIVLQTPNKYDYASLIARLTPFWFHRWLLSRLLDRKEEDTFPTFYRANTRKRIFYLLRQSNLTILVILLFNQYPAYLMFSPFLFLFGIIYERLTSRFNILAQLRGWILVVGKKNGYITGE